MRTESRPTETKIRNPQSAIRDLKMRFIEPHAHMVSRTTDDYLSLATAGCEAVCEPAFWAGFDRGSVEGFYDYFRQLTLHEPERAAKFGLPHFAWLCLNPKESEDLKLAAEVLAIIPKFLDRPNVLGIGEIGLNRNSRNELKVFEQQVDLAARYHNSSWCIRRIWKTSSRARG